MGKIEVKISDVVAMVEKEAAGRGDCLGSFQG